MVEPGASNGPSNGGNMFIVSDRAGEESIVIHLCNDKAEADQVFKAVTIGRYNDESNNGQDKDTWSNCIVPYIKEGALDDNGRTYEEAMEAGVFSIEGGFWVVECQEIEAGGAGVVLEVDRF